MTPSSLCRLSQHSPMARPRMPREVKPMAMRMWSVRGAPRAPNLGDSAAATALSQASRVATCMAAVEHEESA